MNQKTKIMVKEQLRDDLPVIETGDLIKVWQKIKDKDKERVSPFEGVVIAIKHGKGINATMTVRGKVKGFGVEKIFPLHSPTIDRIEVLAKHKVRRAKLYYLRTAKGKRARLRRKEVNNSSKK